jgi:aspartyl protease family protein
MILGIGIAILVGGIVLLVATHDDGGAFGLPSDDLASLIALGALALVIGSAVMVRPVRGGGRLRAAVLWVAAFSALAYVYHYRYELQDLAHRASGGLIAASPLASADLPGRATVVLERGRDSHFQADGVVNGSAVRFLVDTGASSTVLSAADARRIGIDTQALSYDVGVATANGVARAATVRVEEISIGPIVRRNQNVLVTPEGALDRSLLGMSFISSLSGFDMRGSRLILRE